MRPIHVGFPGSNGVLETCGCQARGLFAVGFKALLRHKRTADLDFSMDRPKGNLMWHPPSLSQENIFAGADSVFRWTS